MMHRYLIKYEKIDMLRYIGHLDFLNIFGRALKRAELPILYTSGFNPRQKLSFAFPLPIGMAGLSEYVEVSFSLPVASTEIAQRLNNCLPNGARVLNARPMAGDEKGPASLLRAASFTVEPDNRTDVSAFINKVLESDIGEKIYQLETAKDGVITMTITQGSQHNLKPDIVMRQLYDAMDITYEPYETTYTRRELFRLEGGRLRPLWDLPE